MRWTDYKTGPGVSRHNVEPRYSGTREWQLKNKFARDTLSREGRRFVSTVTTPEDSKRNVKTAQQPIRVFVGLDSAQSEEERANLALAELARTNAYERELIVAALPTGTSCLVGQSHYAMACPLGNQCKR